MMTPQLQEALEWVNHMRTGPLRGPPIDELPKGVPGHTQECVIARALRMGITRVDEVRINSGSHVVVIKHQPSVEGPNPRPVQRVIQQFDAGNLLDLIDYEAYRKLDPSGAPKMPQYLAHQSLAKPFDKLMPKLAQFCPELHLKPSSHVEVSQSFDSMMHVVTVKNPGECPKSMQLTATMVQHMQKALEEEMQKAMCPPILVYNPGNMNFKPGSIIQEMEPMMFTALSQPSQYYAPDWANMMKTPEAPVMVPIEEPAVV